MKFKSDIEVQAGLKDSSGAIGTSGQVLSSTGSNVSWVNQTTIANDVQNRVKAGVAINKGQAVYVTGADGTNIIVGLASNTSEATSSKTLGLLNATVAINGFADVVQIGRLSGLNTIGAVVGDPVWLGTNGNLIYGLANKPYAPAHLVFIGVVTRVNSNNGEIFINVQNGFELKEIHDVDIITNVPINGDVLGYDGTLWVNKTIAEWLGYTPANASGTTNYVSKFTGTTTLGNSLIYDNGSGVGISTTSPISGSGLTIGNDASGGATVKLAFSTSAAERGSLSMNASSGEMRLTSGYSGYGGYTTFYNNGSERMRIDTAGNVGIGTTTPAYKLDVNGTVNINGTFGNRAVESAYRLKFADNGGTANDSGIGMDGYLGGGEQMWFNSLDGFYWTTGTYGEKMRITQAGNVGIGTASPSEKLEVNGNIGLAKTGETFIYNTQSATDSISIGGASYVSFKTYGGGFTEKMRITTAGNVGIGTSSPGSKLTVYSGASVTDYVVFNVGDGSNSMSYVPYVATGDYNNLSFGGGSLLFNTIGSRLTIGTHNGTGIQFGPTNTLISGNVGIGTSMPMYTLHVNGSVAGVGAYVNLSDERYKKDVLPIENALDKVLSLNGVTFNWDKQFNPGTKLDDANHIGLIAQEVEKVIPQAVSTGKDGNQTKSVAYTDLVPVLIEAIKELKLEIEELKKIINK